MTQTTGVHNRKILAKQFMPTT